MRGKLHIRKTSLLEVSVVNAQIEATLPKGLSVFAERMRTPPFLLPLLLAA